MPSTYVGFRWRHFLYILIVLIGAALRIQALTVDVRFTPDEALFASFARDASLRGEWLMPGDLDKPPLTLYANALSMSLFAAHTNANGVLDFTPRQGEFAARLPAALASIIQIALMIALARALYPHDDRVALWTGIFTALSPFIIAYSATALTDGLMLPFGVLAMLYAAKGRPLYAGIALALAFAAKPQGLYFAPLCIVLMLIVSTPNTPVGTRYSASAADTGLPGPYKHILLLIAPTLITLPLISLWDSLRPNSPDLWALAAANNNPARLIRSSELIPRFLDWFQPTYIFLGAGTVILLAAIPLMIAFRIRRDARTHHAAVDLVLVTFVLIFYLVHWLIAFNTYDRYLLIAAPALILLCARSGLWLWRIIGHYFGVTLKAEVALVGAALVLALFGAGINAARAYTPYNDERLRYVGIIDLAAELNALPTATIIYDHWLGWELRFYMGAWADKRRVYFPTPNTLAQAAALDPDLAPRYFPMPAHQAPEVWLDALREAGFASTRIYAQGGFVIYRLERAARES